nr:hypothetical protein [Comamonas sp.]
KNKIGVEQTRINATMTDVGYASKELFVQFMTRLAKEIPTATLAMFSTLKYLNAPNFEKFRDTWNAEYQGGFIVHSKAFDGLNGDFPIGFLIWKTNQTSNKKTPITEIATEVLDKKAQRIGEKKFFNFPNNTYLNVWMDKLETNQELAVPLSNAATVSKNPRMKMSCDGMRGFLFAGNNDFQNAPTGTLIASSIYTGRNGGGVYINDNNLWQAAVVFAVRLLIRHTWINHNDQFLQPSETLTEEFKNDCLLWMLFHGKNLTASADGLEWNGKTWSIVNHFIPFTEAEVDASDRFESDFMVQYLADKVLSPEAKAVLKAGRSLWKAYFSHVDVRAVRDEYKLNRADVGWYQIRNALKARNTSADTTPVNFEPFEKVYQELTNKLRPQVFSLGFLR